MLTSMTGFGKAEGSFAHKKITVEIKSLNSKQFDLSVKMPGAYREKELAIRSSLSKLLSRGKIDLSIYIEAQESDKKVSINQSLALLYLEEIRSLSEKAGLSEKEDILKTLLSMPEVLQTEKAELDEDEWAAVDALITEASQKLASFRSTEGARLASDIEERIRMIDKLREEVETHLEPRLQAVRERIEKNIADLLSSDQADKNRLEQEIIYYLEKLDITEEDIRLKGHCKYFLETMKSDGMVGKKLGFISQEIGREVNTMGSKANYVEIQRLVVQMKDELEKIKEQLLNIC